jgi:hypothetical protein
VVQGKKLISVPVTIPPSAKKAVIDGMAKTERTEKLRKTVTTAQDKEQVYGTCENCKKHKRLKLRDEYLLCHGCWAVDVTGGTLQNLPMKSTASSSSPAGSAPVPPTAASPLPETSASVVKVDLNDDVEVGDEDMAPAVDSGGASSTNASGTKSGLAEKKTKVKGTKKTNKKPEDGHLSRADL